MKTIATLSLLVLPCLTGCAERELSSNESKVEAAKPRASVALRVLVVNEAGLGEALNRLRGEWAEQGMGEIATSEASWADLTGQEKLDADLVIFPSRYLGELCSRGWLRPVRANVLESEELQSSDFYPLVRQELMKWGDETMVVPLGVELAARSENPAVEFLVRVAPRAVSNERLGVLFDTETMKPRLTEPEFVQALTEIVEGGREPAPGASDSSPNSSREQGRSVPAVGFDDRLVAVTSSSRNAASAFKLLQWLASAEVSAQLALAGDGALPARKSQATSSKWYPDETTAEERSRLAESLETTMNSEVYLAIPRIPAVDDYLSALSEAVSLAKAKKETPQAALQKAAERWEQITEAKGRDAQREAYLKHLGISEP